MDITGALEVVAAHPDYKVISRIPALPKQTGPAKFTGCVLDVETTGLVDPAIVELGFVLFGYDDNRKFVGLQEVYGSLHDPGVPLTKEAEAINGITAEMLEGQSIDSVKVKSLLGRVDIVIAHNASFDRPLAEKEVWMPSKPWACSVNEIDWAAHGIPTKKLDYILYRHGLFFEEHRAVDDCLALLHVLGMENDGEYLTEMLLAARKPDYHLFVHGGYDIKDILKLERGYKFCGKEHQIPDSWMTRLGTEEEVRAEREWLESISPGIASTVKAVTASRRWSANMYSAD